MNRRGFLQGFGAVLAWAGLPPLARTAWAQAEGLAFGTPAAFSFDQLQQQARDLAARPFQPRPVKANATLESIDFDTHQKLRYRKEKALWGDAGRPFGVQFFHLHRWVRQGVKIHVLEGGQARELLYRPDYFTYGGTGLDKILPKDLGFAGFRVLNDGKDGPDWLAFQGASYFRTSGPFDQYGLSARGVAINTALPEPEEFPLFTQFWLEQAEGGKSVTIYALLDGPSLAGAYRFVCRKGPTMTMDVSAALFPRAAITRMGVAPLTSMFWYSEANRRQGSDWRPEIHDNDGLALWTGGGERIFRPLNNPVNVMTNSFFDNNPRGFGLLQRDRNFDHYQDDGAYYDRRPALWVEPLGEWGEGAVQLVEIPTNDEIHDNIVAYWVPKAPITAGSRWAFDYRLHWVDQEPYPQEGIGRVVDTWIGRSGIPGQEKGIRPENARKFVIDFAGANLAEMPQRFDILPTVWASRGRIAGSYSLKVVGGDRWRAVFDLLDVEGTQPVDLRCFLPLRNRPLTETWLFQYLPDAHRV